MVPRWWYTILGEEFGPVSFEQLLTLARDGYLDPEDSVRQEGGSVGRPARTVDGLFPISPSAGTLGNAEESLESGGSDGNLPSPEHEPADQQGAAAAASEILHKQLQRAHAKDVVATPPVTRLQSIPPRPAAAPAAPGRFAALHDAIRRTAGRVWLWIGLTGKECLILVAAVLVAAALVGVLFHQPLEASAHAAFAGIWEEILANREAELSDAEWNAFAGTARSRLQPLVARLEDVAGPDRPEALQLLWAGRDYLPAVLSDPRNTGTPAEQRFLEHMRNAQTLINGGEPLRGESGLRTVIPKGFSPVAIVVIVGDFAIIAGLFAFAVRTWKAGRTRDAQHPGPNRSKS